MNKGYNGNSTKLDKYKQEVKKKERDLKFRENRRSEVRKKKKRKEGKIREKGELEEISKKW